MPLIRQLHLALAFLTRLPVKPLGLLPDGALAQAMRLFPVVGAIIGLIAGVVYGLAHLLLPAFAAAGLAVAASVAVTGGLHEDGLADCADGFGGGSDRDGKLAIMKDSRIGAFGVLALGLTLMLRAAALAGIGRPALVIGALMAVHALARAAIPAVMCTLAAVSRNGLAVAAGQPSAATAGMAATIALAIAAVVLPAAVATAAVLAVAAAAVAVGWTAWRQIGGYTGDVLGAVEQLAECGGLLAVLAALPHSP